MPEGMHAGRAHDEVQAGCKQRGNQQVNQQHSHIGRLHGQQRHQHQQGQHDPAGDAVKAGGRAQWRFSSAGMAAGRLRFAEQAPGPGHQHHRHHHKLDDQRELGKRNADAGDLDQPQPDTNRLELGDQQRRHIRAGNRAHAAHHHHHEGSADDVQVHLEVGRLARQLQGAAQSGQKSPEGKHCREQPGLVDAQRADHVAVLRGGPHQRAPARFGQQQPQQTQHHRARHNQKQVIGRELPAQNRHRSGEAGRPGPKQLFSAPEPQHQVLDDQAERKGGQQLKQLGRAVNAAQQQHLDQGAQYGHGQRGQQQ